MDNLLREQIFERGSLAAELSIKSAEIALDFLGKAQKWNKEDSSPVTEADLAIDKQLQEALSKAFPNDAILSEEAESDTSRLSKDLCWIIDPIDGTKEFIKQSDEFCVMIGLCYKGKPVYGVINVPRTNEIFYGGPGFGTFVKKDNREIDLTNHRTEGNKVLVSRSHRGDIALPYLEQNNLDPLPCGSSGVKACRIVDGTAQYYIHCTSIHEWDTAAADALVRGAGGLFTNLRGEDFIYNKRSPVVNGIISSFSREAVDDISSFFEGLVSF